MSCLTEKEGKRNTARHEPGISSAPEPAAANRYTELPNTGSVKRNRLSARRMPDEHDLAEIVAAERWSEYVANRPLSQRPRPSWPGGTAGRAEAAAPLPS